jgi:CTP:molybdopterin cytidylyltransferase MocA
VIGGVILAAGASKRMGRPKALLDYRGETFIDRLIRVVSEVSEPVIVALGYHADTIRPHIKSHARIAINPCPERGQLSSLQTALRELPVDADGFLFLPVDCPTVLENTVQHLATSFAARSPETLFVIPRWRDKRGHPVFAAPDIAREILNLPPEAKARDVVHRHVDRTLYVDVDDSGILTDIDDPAAYQRLIEVQAI